MSGETSNHLKMSLLYASQSQKEVTVNEALARIDALMNTGAVDKDLATPPGSPAAGDVYIVAASPTGAWAGKAGQIAYFDQIWRFIVPNEGVTLWLKDENIHYSYDGSNWIRSHADIVSVYEEGSFSPTMFGSTTAGTPIYAVNSARYVRIGKLVTCWIRITLTSRGGMVGQIRIDGLPYNVRNAVENRAQFNYTSLAAGYSITGIAVSGWAVNNANDIYLTRSTTTSGTTSLLESDITDSFSLYGTVSYEAA